MAPKKQNQKTKPTERMTKEESVIHAKLIVRPGRPCNTQKTYIRPEYKDFSKPSDKDKQAINNIMARISEGEPAYQAIANLKQINREDFYGYVNNSDQLTAIYARACEEREVVMFDKALSVAYDDSNDWYVNEKGASVPNPVAVQRSRLVTDTILKMLATMNRKKYGNSTTLMGDTDNPIQVQQITGMVVE